MTEAGQGHAGAKPIVVGVDGSAPSLVALEWAVRQAELTGAPVVALTCWQWPTTFGYALPLAVEFDPAGDAAKVVDDAVAPIRQAHPSVDIRSSAREGTAAQTLVEASKTAALLVVGSRGHGAFSGMLLGSVSEHCVSHAHCPVVVARP